MFDKFKSLLQMMPSFAVGTCDCLCNKINLVNVFLRLFMSKLLFFPLLPGLYLISKYSDLCCLGRAFGLLRTGGENDWATMSITISSDSDKMALLL